MSFPVKIINSPFRSFELIRGTQQFLTERDPHQKRVEETSLPLLFNGLAGSNPSGPSETRLYLVKSFISNEYTLRRRLDILSESKSKKKTLKKLFTKFLWGNLSDLEEEALILFAIEEEDNLILDTLKTKFQIKIPRILLNARVNALLTMKGMKTIGPREFLSSKGFRLQIEQKYIAPPSSRIKKYSGWKRHQNDQGSLAPEQEDPFPLNPELINEKENFFFPLSVGVFQLTGEGSLKMALINAETERFLKLTSEFCNEYRQFKISEHS